VKDAVPEIKSEKFESTLFETKNQFFCEIRSETAQIVTCEREKHHLEVVTPDSIVLPRTIVQLMASRVTKNAKTSI